MPWADVHIARLATGQQAIFRPHGNSMRGRIASGQRITLDPHIEPQLDHAVLCRCEGRHFVHLVKAIKGHGPKRRYLIGNNRGGINGWIRRAAIYGVVLEGDAKKPRPGNPERGAMKIRFEDPVKT